MDISVIVTTYNSPSQLRRVLESLELQRTRPREVIVADDGSGPETAALVKEMTARAPYPLLHVWHEDKGFRLAKIRNEALKAAGGEYIVILDGDCVVPATFVGDHGALAEPGYFVQGKRALVGKDIADTFGAAEANSKCKLIRLALRGRLKNSHHVLRLPMAPALRNTKMRGTRGCNFAMFRSDAFAVNGYNETFVSWGREDSEFVARLYKLGLSRKEHPFMAVCFHLWHPENPRADLGRNNEILRQTLEGASHRCADGIEKT